MLRASWLFVVTIALACLAIAARPALAQPQPNGYRTMVEPEGMPPLALHVEEMGNGPPLLLLHGLASSSATWHALASRLASRHRLIAIDLRGHGRSEKPFDQHYSPAEHAAVVRAFIRKRGLGKIAVAGHSLGGFISLLLALDPRTSPRISKLVLISTPAYRQPFTPAVELMQRPVLPYLTSLLIPPELPAALALFFENAGAVTQRDVSLYANPLVEPGGSHALISTSRQLVPPDVEEIIRRYGLIRQPALVIHCSEDTVVPVMTSLKLSRALPRAKLTVLDGCHHIPMEQATEDVARAMLKFLAR